MRVLLALAVLLLSVSPVAAGASLEARIESATGIVRPIDATLQARAAVRVIQIQTDFRHCCLAEGEAEIIAWNAGQSDPIGYLVGQWLNSPTHAAILFDPYWHSIGCAVAVSGTRTYGVCLFRGDPAFDTPADPPRTISPTIPSPPDPPGTLPDTAVSQ